MAKHLVISLALLFKIANTINAQTNFSDTVYGRDNFHSSLTSGFYYVIRDTDQERGFKAFDKDEYYFVSRIPVVAITDVGKVYKNYYSILNRHGLMFKFNKRATRKWSDFTKAHQNQQVGLFLGDTLVCAVTIASQITNGTVWLAGGLSEQEIDSFKILFEAEIKKAKNQK